MVLDVARYHYHRAKALRLELDRFAAQELPKTKPAQAKRLDRIISFDTEIRTEHAMTVTAADKVLPYYHSRLAPLERNKAATGEMTLEDLVLQSIPSPANSNAPALIEGPVEDKVDAES